ncbi:ABC transporter substrate-binding protein [Actinomycetaceae bacterium MB13-C1-2]|nr:ABC transporter substrate-binding protein [Actinomycetaceae bacterium MB13-C1-2]
MTPTNRNRLVSVLAASVLGASAIAGCASGGTSNESNGQSGSASPDSAGAETSPADETYRIAFIPGISSDPFFGAMEIAAEEEATALGVELVYQGSSAEYSPQAQLPFIDSAIADGVDAIIIAATDADALQTPVDRAIELGIPVVTVDTSVTNQDNLVAHITGDNKDGGSKAAETMAELIGGEGKVFIISGSPTITTDTLRVEGFEEAIETNFPAIEIVGVDYAYSQPSEATTKVAAALLNNPDIKGIFSAEGNAGVGAVAALRDANLTGDVVLIGYDAYQNQVEELEDGIYTALIAQDPGQEARLALQAAIAAIQGEEAAATSVVVPNVVMTQDNLEETRIYTYASK